MPERDGQRDERNDREYRAFEPAQRIVVEVEIGWDRQGRHLRRAAADQQRQRAPDQERDHHHGGDLHDPQRFGAGFVDAFDVGPPEINGDQHGESGGEHVGRNAKRRMHQLR